METVQFEQKEIKRKNKRNFVENKTDMQRVVKYSKVTCCLDKRNEFQSVLSYVLSCLAGYAVFHTEVGGSSV
jgi:hypothetical protein